MNILVTGSKGQLGKEIEIASKAYTEDHFFFTDIEDLDITQKEAVIKYVENNKIDCIINCAAYTAVDKAEEEEEKAFLINEKAVKNLASAANKAHASLVHISTDYVFNGKRHKPYREGRETNPNSAYGRSKLAGEEAIIQKAFQAAIVRTSWLCSAHGHNFIKTILKYGREREDLKVVFDQVGTPTNATDLASAVLMIAQNMKEIEGTEIFHFSNEGVCSWYDFALEIIEQTKIDCKIYPIVTKDYPLPANRPAYSVLDKRKIKDFLGIEIPHWKDGVKRILKELNEI